MAQRIKTLTGSNSKIVYIPQRPGQTSRESISAAKAKKAFGWSAETAFQSGLEKTYKWLKKIPRKDL
jgi:dTDP-D-glucose 4,6-dehydratase